MNTSLQQQQQLRSSYLPVLLTLVMYSGTSTRIVASLATDVVQHCATVWVPTAFAHAALANSKPLIS